MRLSRSKAEFLSLLAAVGIVGQLQADPITLGSGSSIQATANDFSAATVQTTDPVNSLPFTKVTTALSLPSSSSITSTLTTSGFNLAFAQSIGNSGFTEGLATLNFTANQSAAFTISGNMTVNGAFTIAGLTVQLFDVTADSYVYNYDKGTNTFPIFQGIQPAGVFVPTATLVADASGGSLTGNLIAGHSYVFTADENMNNEIDPTLNGNVAITFAGPVGPSGSGVPLPPAVYGGALAAIVGAGLMLAQRKSMNI